MNYTFVGLSFGASLKDGYANEQIASTIRKIARFSPNSQIYAQHEVAHFLSDVHCVGEPLSPSFLGTNITTTDVLEQVKEQSQDSQFLYFGHEKHLPRVLREADQMGIGGKGIGVKCFNWDREDPQAFRRSPIRYTLREKLVPFGKVYYSFTRNFSNR